MPIPALALALAAPLAHGQLDRRWHLVTPAAVALVVASSVVAVAGWSLPMRTLDPAHEDLRDRKYELVRTACDRYRVYHLNTVEPIDIDVDCSSPYRTIWGR